MKKPVIIGIIAAIFIAVLAFIIITSGQNVSSHTISLPSPASDDGSSPENDGIDRIEVKPETVKVVLGTLTRTESFSRSYTLTSVWDGGQSESTLNYWQSGENIRLSISKNNTVRNILVRGSELYVWYDGYSGVFKSTLSESSVGSEVDRFAGLITYEDIMDVPDEDILEASYVNQSGTPCIYVEYKGGSFDYVNQLYISVSTGLLVSASTYDGDTLVSSLISASTDLSTPSDSIFSIPA